MYSDFLISQYFVVALFTRAWIEIRVQKPFFVKKAVALFTRAWIEIQILENEISRLAGRPLHEGVD